MAADEQTDRGQDVQVYKLDLCHMTFADQKADDKDRRGKTCRTEDQIVIHMSIQKIQHKEKAGSRLAPLLELFTSNNDSGSRPPAEQLL